MRAWSGMRPLGCVVAAALLCASCRPFGLSRQDIIVTVAGTGVAGYGGDGEAAVLALIAGPAGMVLDGSGNLYFSDSGNACIRMVDTDGLITVFAGLPQDPGFSGDDGPATAARLDHPGGLAWDPDGALVFADSRNHRVRRIALDTGIITTIAGTGQESYGGDGGPALEAGLDHPQDVAYDSQGRLHIADTGNNRVRVVSEDVMSTAAGTGVAGYGGDGEAAVDALLSQPFALFLDAADSLYIADSGNFCIRRVDVEGLISTVAGTGTEGYVRPSGPVVTTAIGPTRGVALDPEGSLYLTEDTRVRRLDSLGYLGPVAGDRWGDAGDDGPAGQASFMDPWSIVFDADGSLYVTDHEANRIRKIIADSGP